jgi:hypothetical protein
VPAVIDWIKVGRAPASLVVVHSRLAMVPRQPGALHVQGYASVGPIHRSTAHSELFIGGHVPQDHDVQFERTAISPSLDGLAIGMAAVIEVPQFIAASSAVDDGSIRQAEQIGAVAVPVSRRDLRWRHAPASIDAQARVGGKKSLGEQAEALDRAVANLEEGREMAWSVAQARSAPQGRGSGRLLEEQLHRSCTRQAGEAQREHRQIGSIKIESH